MYMEADINTVETLAISVTNYKLTFRLKTNIFNHHLPNFMKPLYQTQMKKIFANWTLHH